MKKWHLLGVVCGICIGISCQREQHSGRTLTEINRQMIIGDWYPKNEYTFDDSPEPEEEYIINWDLMKKFNLNAYRFMVDHICENHLGFYEYGDPENGYDLAHPLKPAFNKLPSSYDRDYGGHLWQDNIVRSYGSRSVYRILDDSLYIYEPGLKDWVAYRMVFQTADTLSLLSKNDSVSGMYLRRHYEVDEKPWIDQIIIRYPETSYSHSGLFSIRRSGEYLHTSWGERYEGKLGENVFEQIENRFKIANQIYPLDSLYFPDKPQKETDGTVITFIMDGQMKTIDHVLDYISIEDRELYQAFLRTLFLPDYMYYEPDPDYAKHLPDNIWDKLRGGQTFMRKDSAVIDLYSTESFYLKTLILSAKQSEQEFSPTYKIVVYDFDNYKFVERAETDGRYYRYLLNDSLLILDIGFNFIEKYGLERRLSAN